MALFISFEGGEGSGKSTQAGRLVRAFESLGIPALQIYEPGTTNLGRHIRNLIKGYPWGDDTISHGAELFLFSASRAELVSKVLSKQIKDPCLAIIADRYADSTVAYQSYGRRMNRDLVTSVNKLATQGIMPDVTFLLDCPPINGLERVGPVQTGLFELEVTGRLEEEGLRRFEDEPLAFHRRVRAGYLKLAQSEPKRWVIVDGSEDEDSVFDTICQAIGGMEQFHKLIDNLVTQGIISNRPNADDFPLFAAAESSSGR